MKVRLGCMKTLFLPMVAGALMGCGKKESPESSVKTPPVSVVSENTGLEPRPEETEESRNSGIPSSAKVHREKNDVQENGFKGRVKTVKITTSKTMMGSNGKPQKEGYVDALGKFDENGYLLEWVDYRKGKIQAIHMPTHDDKMYIVKTEKFNPDGSSRGWSSDRYNENGKRVESIIYSLKGEPWFQAKYTYDENDRLAKTVRKGVIEPDVTIYKYDATGKKISTVRHLGNSHSKQSFKYNERGDVAEILSFNDQGDIKTKKSYDYDAQGILIKSTTVGALGWKIVDEYDSSGDVFRTMHADTSKPTEFLMSSHVYDEQGNKIKEVKELRAVKNRDGKRFTPTEETIWEFTYWD